eukprot:scaffold1923_cov333-Pavlova_lutheri.AAC.2
MAGKGRTCPLLQSYERPHEHVQLWTRHAHLPSTRNTSCRTVRLVSLRPPPRAGASNPSCACAVIDRGLVPALKPQAVERMKSMPVRILAYVTPNAILFDRLSWRNEADSERRREFHRTRKA